MKKIKACRICNSKDLIDTIDLGNLALSGKFFKNISMVPRRKLSLVMCNKCGLNQISQVYDLSMLYDMNYGYQSSLNKSMYDHLRKKANNLKSRFKLNKTDVIVDIGSNDATTLSFFKNYNLKIGIDKIAKKFKDNYQLINAKRIDDFFPSKKLLNILGKNKVKLVSAYSCFYDLPDPIKFAKGISKILHPNGIWVIEQSYFPEMLKTNSFDTICHEHIEYYRLKDIKNICERANLKIIDVEFNDINGGSFSVIISHITSALRVKKNVSKILNNEKKVNWFKEINKFIKRIHNEKFKTIRFLNNQLRRNKTVLGIGASTKGSILLQHYQISNKQISLIGEVNQDKFGCKTPGTQIKIVPEKQILELKPDYIFIFTWHFKKFFLKNKNFKNFKLVFPLPKFEIINN